MFNSFEDEIHVYQSFIRNNFDLLGKNYEIIKEQFVIQSGIIDILAYNKDYQRLAIIELKNIITTDQVLSQVMKYYNEMKNKYINNYIITDLPEIIIIAPEFDKKFNLYIQNIDIKLIQIDYDNINNHIIYTRFFPNTNLNISNEKELFFKNKKNIDINIEQKILINNIINKIKQIYKDKQLKIINCDDHIDILHKKMIVKIIYSTKWFDNTVQLNIYNNFIKPITKSMIEYDPSIKKFNFLKRIIKLSINNIPQFLLENN